MNAKAGIPTIILVGGPFTADTGEQLDSRQAVDNDPWSTIARTSLATSDLWWLTVISVVMPLLDSGDPDSFAAVGGPRSTVAVKPDGTLIRNRLSNLLPRGVRRKNQDGKWQFVEMGELWSPESWNVVVDTWGWFWANALSAHDYREFEDIWLKHGVLTVVAPHTHAAQIFLDGYTKWVSDGRYTDAPGAPLPEFDWNINGLPSVVPVESDFRITGLIQSGSWIDPGPLESARRLLQARYDLKIGIWDLVSNDILRATLLEELEATNAPEEPAPKPLRAIERETKSRANISAADRKQEGQENAVATAITQLVANHGWTVPERGVRGDRDPDHRFRCALVVTTAPMCAPTEARNRHPNLRPGMPILWISLEVNPNLLGHFEVELVLPAPLSYRPSNPVEAFVLFADQGALARIASPYIRKVSVSHRGIGGPALYALLSWDGDPADCGKAIAAVAERGPAWVELLQPLGKQTCDEIAADPRLGHGESREENLRRELEKHRID
jgi:hypothetical protein